MEQIRSGPMAGRTVLVTGGSGGIGRATALGLAAMGAHLAITGRDRGRTQDAAREIRAADRGQVDIFVTDLSCQSQVRRLAGEALQSLSRIDVPVNNAGGYWNTRHVTDDGLERTFAINHLAPFLLTKRHSRNSARNPAAAKGWSRARRWPASHRVNGCGRTSGSAGADP
jgi:retinol dehydrogenase 14